MITVPLDILLDTPRCILRAVSEADVPFVWSATRFAGFNDGMRWEAPNRPEELIDANHRNLQAWKSGEEFSFTIADTATLSPIGRASIRKGSHEGVWAFGYWVHPEHWGKGFAVEAASALIEFGFSQLGAAEIMVAHAIWNHQSRRVVEKLGMRLVRENPCGFVKNGQPVAEHEYVITREERSNI